jgi:hypothetical protein
MLSYHTNYIVNSQIEERHSAVSAERDVCYGLIAVRKMLCQSTQNQDLLVKSHASCLWHYWAEVTGSIDTTTITRGGIDL